MKKLYKRVITYILIFIISVICVNPMKVFAYGGFFTTDSFSKTGTWTDANSVPHSAYVMQDDTNIPSGYHYYMRVADGVAICCDGSEVITNILNYKIGLVMSAGAISNFITSYLDDNAFTGQSPTFYENHPPVLKGGSIVGIALNELTGCRMAQAENNDSVSIPSDVSNDIYNYYNNVYIVENPQLPDYVVVPSATLASAAENGLEVQNIIDYFSNTTYKFTIGYNYKKNKWNPRPASTGGSPYVIPGNPSEAIFASYSTSNFDNYCRSFGLTIDNYTLTVPQVMTSTAGDLMEVHAYNAETKVDYNRWSSINISDYSVSAVAGYPTLGGGILPYTTDGSSITVYRSTGIVTQITNNIYSPSTYTTENYKNYSTSNDNSYTSNVQNINNSSTNNSNIYNESKTTTNNDIVEDSYNVTTINTTTNITNITNNYYGDNGAPDNGGGGDDNGGDDDDDDTIWKALLKAIGDFLKKIGELIATILTGIISIMTSVVNAIASITTSFTAVTDFLGSVFGFLPSDLVAVITLGVTLGILISLIKMFGK